MTTSQQGAANFEESGNSLTFLHEKRKEELDAAFSMFAPNELKNCSILEIGSGTGYQLTLLKKLFESAQGLDLATSRLRNYRTDDITEYDGRNIPFDDNSFDFVYSSNVMEHVVHLDIMNQEIARILKPHGTIVHLMPTHSWRIWTLISGYCSLPYRIYGKIKRNRQSQIVMPDTETKSAPEIATDYPSKGRVIKNIIFPPRHGERGNSLSEIYYFHPKWWLKKFDREPALSLYSHAPTGIFYTGWALLNSRMTWPVRRKLSKYLGSACHIYILNKTDLHDPEK